jgi:hypothetical protein
MTKQIYMPILLACLLNLPAAVPSMADEADEVEEEGPRNCLTTRRITKTIVVNDLNILFLVTGKTAYLNILPKQCKGLSRYRRFSYATTAGSLCNLDTIQVVSGSSYAGKRCVLGSFHPVNKADALAVIEEPREQPDAKSLPSADVEDIIGESDDLSDPTLN